MFCPQCGSTQSDELNYCKSCGANLGALRQVMSSRDNDGKIDWTKTWVGGMIMSSEEKRRVRGITPAIRRRNEIKAGVITASAGTSLTIVLSVLMEAIVLNANLSALAADILSRIWVVGLIPIMVGLALIFNGAVISRNAAGGDTNEKMPAEPVDKPDQGYLSPAETRDLATGVSSVTDETTAHLKVPR